jgi:hypothetical protein
MVTVALVFDRVRTVFSALTAQSSMYRPLWLVGASLQMVFPMV